MSNVIYYRVAGDSGIQANSFVQKKCIMCGDEVFFLMTKYQYDQWIVNKKYIQDVFPHVSKDIREWMISGTHPNCWDKLYQEPDEVKIYTWKSGETNILCDACAEDMFSSIYRQIEMMNPDVFQEQLMEFESYKEVEETNMNAIQTSIPCQPVRKDDLGNPMCILSTQGIDYDRHL